MNETQVQDALWEAFEVGGHRIVFWNDPESGFSGEVESVLPDGVELIRLPGPSMLEAKIELEVNRPEQKFLVYDTREEPDMAKDWLLDIRRYSYAFTADRASVMLQELGLELLSLKDHLKDRDRFMASRKRVAQLKTLVEPSDSKEDLDLKMLAVVMKAESPDMQAILRRLFASLVEEDAGGLDAVPQGWEEIGKFGLEPSFWDEVERAFGYADESPNLKALLLRVFASDLAKQSAGIQGILGMDHLLLPEHGQRLSKVFLARWSDSHRMSESYDTVAREAQVALGAEEALVGLDLTTLQGLTTFPCTEWAVLKALIRQIREQWQTPASDEWLEIVQRREAGHWVRAEGERSSHWRAFHHAYRAVRAAVELITEWLSIKDAAWPSDLETSWKEYTDRWWLIDQAYRHFNTEAERIERHGWDILKGLRETLEEIYVNGYLRELSLQWGPQIEGRLDTWKIDGVQNQYRFFDRQVRPQLDKSINHKAMVIISDGLRFEAARELVNNLNQRYRFEAEIDTQLSVLPSYTALGMASLLPHDNLAYAADGKTVRVDDRPAASTDQRSAVLSAHEGMAIQSEDLIGLTKAEGRARLEGARLVYVYHNRIDAAGDGPTEEQAFAATEQTIDELAQLVHKAVNDLNYSYVVLTADHGFLFTQGSPDATSRTSLDQAPAGALVAKKRYIVGKDFSSSDQSYRGSTAVTAGTDPGMDFLIPRGTNLFHFVGGARYVHGGTMPQEIVVPMLRIRALRGAKAESTRTSSVRLQVLGGNHRVTTGRHRFKIMQLDPASERVRPVTVRVDIRDGDEPVSDFQPLTFDSTSSDIEGRTREVYLTLKDVTFDRQKKYTLVIRDAETGVTVTRADVQIDRAFTDDF
jgi:uncharacterized protein (TIGR02687 family)